MKRETDRRVDGDNFERSISREYEKLREEIEDDVLNPSHYTRGREIEPLEVIEDWDLDRDYYLGNAIKYISRYNRKDSIEDPITCLKKAIFYIQRKIDRYEGKM